MNGYLLLAEKMAVEKSVERSAEDWFVLGSAVVPESAAGTFVEAQTAAAAAEECSGHCLYYFFPLPPRSYSVLTAQRADAASSAGRPPAARWP